LDELKIHKIYFRDIRKYSYRVGDKIDLILADHEPGIYELYLRRDFRKEKIFRLNIEENNKVIENGTVEITDNNIDIPVTVEIKQIDIEYNDYYIVSKKIDEKELNDVADYYARTTRLIEIYNVIKNIHISEIDKSVFCVGDTITLKMIDHEIGKYQLFLKRKKNKDFEIQLEDPFEINDNNKSHYEKNVRIPPIEVESDDYFISSKRLFGSGFSDLSYGETSNTIGIYNYSYLRSVVIGIFSGILTYILIFFNKDYFLTEFLENSSFQEYIKDVFDSVLMGLSFGIISILFAFLAPYLNSKKLIDFGVNIEHKSLSYIILFIVLGCYFYAFSYRGIVIPFIIIFCIIIFFSAFFLLLIYRLRNKRKLNYIFEIIYGPFLLLILIFLSLNFALYNIFKFDSNSKIGFTNVDDFKDITKYICISKELSKGKRKDIVYFYSLALVELENAEINFNEYNTEQIKVNKKQIHGETVFDNEIIEIKCFLTGFIKFNGYIEVDFTKIADFETYCHFKELIDKEKDKTSKVITNIDSFYLPLRDNKYISISKISEENK